VIPSYLYIWEEIPLRTGYLFVGWNTKVNGSGESYNPGVNVRNLTDINNATITLYAQWIDIISPVITITGTEMVLGVETVEGINNVSLNVSASDNGTGILSIVLSDSAGKEVARGRDSISCYVTTNGTFTYTVTATDNAGNVSTKSFTVNILSLNADIVNANNLSSTVFVRGDRGLLRINVSGQIERLEIVFPAIFITQELSPNITITLIPKSTDTYNHEFIIPLQNIPDNTYTVTVKATRGSKVLTSSPTFTVNGSVLNQIKNVIKTYPKTKWN